jgi:hypothetical protein
VTGAERERSGVSFGCHCWRSCRGSTRTSTTPYRVDPADPRQALEGRTGPSRSPPRGYDSLRSSGRRRTERSPWRRSARRPPPVRASVSPTLGVKPAKRSHHQGMAPMVRAGRAEPSELFARSADGHWRSCGCLCRRLPARSPTTTPASPTPRPDKRPSGTTARPKSSTCDALPPCPRRTGRGLLLRLTAGLEQKSRHGQEPRAYGRFGSLLPRVHRRVTFTDRCA